jgi:hypothetical protein
MEIVTAGPIFLQKKSIIYAVGGHGSGESELNQSWMFNHGWTRMNKFTPRLEKHLSAVTRNKPLC